MRLILATAVLSACTALAQYDLGNDVWEDESELQARDAAWGHAHGGPAPSYRGFEEMAQNYPGHPAKAMGKKHHARSEDGDEEDGWFEWAGEFPNNVARAVKGAYGQASHKAEEAVEHAKAKARYHEDEHHGQNWGQRHWARDAEDEELEDEHNEDDGYWEIDWDPSTTFEEGDPDAHKLSARDIDDDLEAESNDDPSEVAFDDDEQDLPDPKLEMESLYDGGLDERDVDDNEFADAMFARDAEDPIQSEEDVDVEAFYGEEYEGTYDQDEGVDDFENDFEDDDELEKRDADRKVLHGADAAAKPIIVQPGATPTTASKHKPAAPKTRHPKPTKAGWWPFGY